MTLRLHIKHRLGGIMLEAQMELSDGITMLYGASGSGKTSIIKAVAGLMTPEEGHIVLNDVTLFDSKAGINIPAHRRRMGMIFQEARLFPHMDVLGNLRFGWRHRKGRGVSGLEESRIIDLLGIGHLLNRRPQFLSGGEQQRVAIGRALLSHPQMLLADEPLASLDQARKNEILPYFERLNAELGMPMLYVSHDPVEVARLGSHIVALEDGQVRAQGDALAILHDPDVNPMGVRAAGAVIMASLMTHEDDGISICKAGENFLYLPHIDALPGARLRLRVPASDVMLAKGKKPKQISSLNILLGRVVGMRGGTGPGTLVSVETGSGLILARVTRRAAMQMNLQVGDDCYALIKALSVAPENIGQTS